jgi:hypothetical protein
MTKVMASTGQARRHSPCPTQALGLMSLGRPSIIPRTSFSGQTVMQAAVQMHLCSSILGWSDGGSRWPSASERASTCAWRRASPRRSSHHPTRPSPVAPPTTQAAMVIGSVKLLR